MAEIATPTLDRVAEISDDSHKIGGFLEWLEGEGIVLGEWDGGSEENRFPFARLIPLVRTVDMLLHEYFKIDKGQEEAERRAILAEARNKLNQGG